MHDFEDDHILIECLFKASLENHDFIKSVFKDNLPSSWSTKVKAPQELPINRKSKQCNKMCE